MPEDTRDPAKVAYDAQVAADEAAKRLGDKLAGDTRIDYSGLLGQPPPRPSYEDCSQLQQPGIVQTGAVVASALNGFWGNVRSFFGADPHEQYAQAAALQMYAQGKNRCWQGVTEQATAYLKATDRYARERLAAGKALEEVAREARAAQGMNMGPEAWAGELVDPDHAGKAMVGHVTTPKTPGGGGAPSGGAFSRPVSELVGGSAGAGGSALDAGAVAAPDRAGPSLVERVFGAGVGMAFGYGAVYLMDPGPQWQYTLQGPGAGYTMTAGTGSWVYAAGLVGGGAVGWFGSPLAFRLLA